MKATIDTHTDERPAGYPRHGEPSREPPRPPNDWGAAVNLVDLLATQRFEFDARVSNVMQPLPWVLRQAAMQNMTHRPGCTIRQGRPFRIGLEYCGERIGHILVPEGAPSREHLEQHAAKRPDVAPLVGWPRLGLLWCHVRRGAENHAYPGHRRRRDRR